MKTTLRILSLALVLALCLLAAGCGQSNKTTLRVYNWGDYIDPDVIDGFMAENPDIRIVYDEYDSNEAMLAKLDGGAKYDILFPSDYMVERLINEDRLAALDLDKIPNIKNVDDSFRNLAFDPDNAYSVPYTFGTFGILYNTALVDETVDSWTVLFDVKNKGRVIMYDSVRDSMAVALKTLGYSVNERDEARLEEAGELLRKQKADGIVKAYMTDTIKEDMISGSTAFGIVYSGDAVLCMDENEDLAYVVPKEGSNFFVDCAVVTKDCENLDAAHRFLNYLLDAEVAAKNCEYIGYSSPNAAAVALMGAEYLAIDAHNPSDEILARCEIYLDLGDFTAIYNRIWESIRYRQ